MHVYSIYLPNDRLAINTNTEEFGLANDGTMPLISSVK